jgi:hypothetical protein
MTSYIGKCWGEGGNGEAYALEYRASRSMTTVWALLASRGGVLSSVLVVSVSSPSPDSEYEPGAWATRERVRGWETGEKGGDPHSEGVEDAGELGASLAGGWLGGDVSASGRGETEGGIRGFDGDCTDVA